MNKILALTVAACAAFSLNLAHAQDDDTWNPDPNRLPGPKHFDPASCAKYPEVCRAREETIRRQYQECLDRGDKDCAPPKKPKKSRPKAAPQP